MHISHILPAPLGHLFFLASYAAAAAFTADPVAPSAPPPPAPPPASPTSPAPRQPAPRTPLPLRPPRHRRAPLLPSYRVPHSPSSPTHTPYTPEVSRAEPYVCRVNARAFEICITHSLNLTHAWPLALLAAQFQFAMALIPDPRPNKSQALIPRFTATTNCAFYASLILGASDYLGFYLNPNGNALDECLAADACLYACPCLIGQGQFVYSSPTLLRATHHGRRRSSPSLCCPRHDRVPLL